MTKFQELYEFVDRAIKSRKYPENTGGALKAALKLFDKELKDTERESIDEFKKNLGQIYQQIFAKNKNFTAASLATYRSRVGKVLNDYEKYGVDPSKMANWSPKTRKVSSKNTDKEIISNGADSVFLPSDSNFNRSEMHRIELVLRLGVKSIIIVPNDINTAEVNKIKMVLDSLSSATVNP